MTVDFNGLSQLLSTANATAKKNDQAIKLFTLTDDNTPSFGEKMAGKQDETFGQVSSSQVVEHLTLGQELTSNKSYFPSSIVSDLPVGIASISHTTSAVEPELTKPLKEVVNLISHELSIIEGHADLEFSGVIIQQSSIGSSFHEVITPTLESGELFELYTEIRLTAPSSATNTNVNSQVSIVTARLIPFGVKASGYLSNIGTQSQHLANPLKSSNESQSVQSLSKRFNAHTANFNLQHTMPFRNEALTSYFTHQWVTTAVKNTSPESLEKKLLSQPVLAEISKQYWLFTSNGETNTLWYRDFSLTNESKEKVLLRVTGGQFVKENNIEKIFINGSMVWSQKEGVYND